ncbi:hypothetical protein HDU86_007386 [Geranomyces michiganensis]|nr:hypothetical protein HDU86_007386 [Geranomyces michiganensis]
MDDSSWRVPGPALFLRQFPNSNFDDYRDHLTAIRDYVRSTASLEDRDNAKIDRFNKRVHKRYMAYSALGSSTLPASPVPRITRRDTSACEDLSYDTIRAAHLGFMIKPVCSGIRIGETYSALGSSTLPALPVPRITRRDTSACEDLSYDTIRADARAFETARLAVENEKQTGLKVMRDFAEPAAQLVRRHCTAPPDTPTPVRHNEPAVRAEAVPAEHDEPYATAKKDAPYAEEDAQCAIPDNYVHLVEAMAASHHPDTAQEGRHLQDFLRWHIVDAAHADLNVKYRGINYGNLRHSLRPPPIDVAMIKALSYMPHLKEYDTAMAELVEKGSLNSGAQSWFQFPFCTGKRLMDCIPPALGVSLLTAIAVDAALAAPSRCEASTKTLVSRIITDSVFFCAPSLGIRYEYIHQFNETASEGCRKSDLTITAPSKRDEVGVFVCEFQRDIAPIHKDYLVCAAEGVFESRKLLPLCELNEIDDARIHLAYVADAVIEFNLVFPVSGQGGFFWAIDRRGPTFDLSIGPIAGRALEVFKLVDFLRQVVFPDALKVQALLRRCGVKSLEISSRLPSFRGAAPRSRETTALYTPYKKRIR